MKKLRIWHAAWIFALHLLFVFASARAAESVTYTNLTRPGPIAIQLLKIPRQSRALEIQSVHSGGKPIGLAPLTDQLKLIEGGAVVAAINGDFYQREGPFAGDPRGLQIVGGELISAPTGSTTFWIDAIGEPHITNTQSGLRLTWPSGVTVPIGLNAKCEANIIELYTPGLGSAPRGNSGREIVLSPMGGDAHAPFRAGREYSMKVVETRDAGNVPIAAGTFLLTLGPTAAKAAPPVQSGAILKISTATIPSLRGVKNAISGGPTLLASGKKRRFDSTASDSYQYSSMLEKHPRTALGWNNNEYFWVEVDGRSKESVGMTLTELATFMQELGCEEAMNLDGGGSATFWYDGKIRNRPCDGYERPIANALVLVRKPQPNAK